MTIKQMKSILATNKFDNIECNFKLKTKGPVAPSWFIEFVNNEFKPLIHEVKSINSRIDKLESRIENLVAKNKLKE